MSTETNLFNIHPCSYDRRALPRLKREWVGRRVAVRYITERGTPNRRTRMGWSWGVLIQVDQDHLVAVRERDGRVKNIHFRRVTAVFDLSRRLPGNQDITPGSEASVACATSEDGVPSSMNPSREFRAERARGKSTQWDAMREMCRAYND